MPRGKPISIEALERACAKLPQDRPFRTREFYKCMGAVKGWPRPRYVGQMPWMEATSLRGVLERKGYIRKAAPVPGSKHEWMWEVWKGPSVDEIREAQRLMGRIGTV